MGSGPFSNPEQDDTRAQTFFVPPGPRPPEPDEFWRREPKRRYIILFLLTFVTTTLAGASFYGGFVFGFSETPPSPLPTTTDLLVHGLFYSVPVLAILGAHEFGHYFACVYYRVNASLPYFLPLPIFLTGTLGAVIRIRAPIPTKRALFDIGIAGPIAGFLVAAPTLLIGMMMSQVITIPASFQGEGLEFGEPLLLKAAAWMVFGPLPSGQTLSLHPVGYAAWFGMLATALNLFPIGQLDGGHISYAVFGRHSTAITLATVVVLIGLTAFSISWVVWAAVTIAMLIIVGPRHPKVFDEHIPLDAGRMWLALFALFMFVVCFTPAPITELKDFVAPR